MVSSAALSVHVRQEKVGKQVRSGLEISKWEGGKRGKITYLRCVQEFSRNEPEKKGGREVKTEGVRMGKEG